MKSRMKYISLFLLIIVYAFSSAGCANLSGPTDEDVIKAIKDSGRFAGGFGGLTLQAPIVVLEKGSRTKDGFWPVKAKVVFTYYVSKEKASAPEEKTLDLKMYKAKDRAGKTIWKAE